MINRRDILKALAATGIGTAVFHRAVAEMGQQEITLETVKSAAWIADIELSDEEFKKILNSLNRQTAQIARLRKNSLPVETPPAFLFKTLAKSEANPTINRKIEIAVDESLQLPSSDDEIAFLPISKLAQLVRSRKITSQRLTEIYLKRLKKYASMLRCVVNLTEDLALKQSVQADKEIAAGNYRGPLHGIPWGAKDLINVPGYPTTWGIPHFKDRIVDEKATVYERLEAAGAVLVAKLSLGAIAMGDLWYEGRTRNPWNPKKGSSGSSAGSASATAAGLVGFSIGSETLGSITSPSRVCGVTGFRPSFGRVSRHGCMPLSWTMDKIGPICRSAKDCALVFSVIHGRDELDPTTYDASFDIPKSFDPQGIKIGYTTSKDLDEVPEYQILKDLQCEFVKIKMPGGFTPQVLVNVIDVEAAAGFDYLLRDGHNEGWNAWTNIFRTANFISAVDYVRMMRMRTVLMKDMEELMQSVDFLFNVFDIFQTNLTGHPSIIIPREFEESEQNQFLPKTVSLTGRLNDDARLLQLAHEYQTKLGPLNKRPALDFWLTQFESGELDKKESKEEQTDKSQSSQQKDDDG